MNRESPSDEMNRFLNDVKEQIQYKPIRPEIEEEMKAHIEDRTKEYMEMGLEEKEALHRAVEHMGDGSSIGIMMNEARHVKNYRPLSGMVLAAVLLGIAGNFTENRLTWSEGLPYGISVLIDNLYYFVWGLIVLTVIYHKGYTFMVKHSGFILAGFVFTGLAAVLLSRFNIFFQDFLPIFGGILFSGHVLSFNWLLLAGPVLALAAYKWRRKGRTVIIVHMALLLAMLLIQYKCNHEFVLTASLILMVTGMVNLFSLIMKGLIPGDKRNLILCGLAGILVTLGIFGAVSLKEQERNIRMFLNPEQQADNHWQDGYNGVLMKDLLKKAELAGPIRLSKEELMHYGTGAWFFNQEEVDNITRYLNYDESEVTLEDILPQHYHNNYRFAFWILKYGWIPALVLIAFIISLYGLLFAVTKKINNKLGHILALSCSVCLSVQMVLYLFGNLGYQYGYFSTLPFISEGLCSITTNMVLVGIILSAYRYDSVIKEENYLNKVVKTGKT